MILLHYYKTFEFWLLRKLGLINFGYLGIGSIVKYGLFGNPENLKIGDYVYIGENSKLWALGGINIGTGTIIAPNVIIRSSNHDYKNGGSIPYSEKIELKKVQIGENCWIGDGVLITPGSKIGEGCIVGMGCVVSGTIPDFSVLIGNPCKIVKTRNIEEYRLLKKQGEIYLKNKIIGKI